MTLLMFAQLLGTMLAILLPVALTVGGITWFYLHQMKKLDALDAEAARAKHPQAA